MHTHARACVCVCVCVFVCVCVCVSVSELSVNLSPDCGIPWQRSPESSGISLFFSVRPCIRFLELRRHGVIVILSDNLKYSSGKSTLLIGKPSINGPFSMAMLNNQRVDGT